jgi:DNA polymerase-3 subunit alpha (Gram-positive type)
LSTTITIKPDAGNDVLKDISALTGNQVLLKQIVVDTKDHRIDVSLSSKNPPSEREMRCIEDLLLARLGSQGITVRLFWHGLPGTPLAELLESNMAFLRQQMARAAPAIMGMTGPLDILCQGESSLEIRLPGTIVLEAASRRKYRESLRDAVEVCLGRSPVVRIAALGKDEAQDLMPADPPGPVPLAQDASGDKGASTAHGASAGETGPAGSPAHGKRVIVGRHITSDPCPVDAVPDAPATVVVEGEAFEVEHRTSRNGGHLLRFFLTDGHDSIAIRVTSKSMCALEDGAWVRVRGKVEADRMSGEPVISARDIELKDRPTRDDVSEEKRVELHLHTKMSSMDSVLSLKDAFETAKRWGHKAIAVTDHGVVQAFPEASEIAAELGLKVLYGLEAYMVDSTEEPAAPYHVVLIARNLDGLHQLYKLVTVSHLEHFYRRPLLLRKEIQESRRDLLVGSACEAGELYRLVRSGAPDDAVVSCAEFYDYLEIQPLANNEFLLEDGKTTREDLASFNKRIHDTGKSLGKTVVAAGDVHFVDPGDAVYRKVLFTAQGYSDAERDSPLYLRTTAEMLEEFAYLGEEAARAVVISGPDHVASLVEDLRPVPSGFFAPDIPEAPAVVESTARHEATRLYGERLPPVVQERLDREIAAIMGGGYAGIYYIAQKLVAKSLEQGYLVGSRGSVGSSFVARLFGITEVNPLPPHYRCSHCAFSDFDGKDQFDSGFDLPPKTCPICDTDLVRDGHRISFEVFMGYRGDKVPDIDLNFSGENQASIIRYTEELLGKGNVFRAGTIATVAERTAYGIVKSYQEATGKSQTRAEQARLARGLIGVRRTTGQHPGGVLVLPGGKDILEFTPLQYPADDRKSGTVTTHFDYDSISSRLLKLDILGHDDPTALRMLKDYTGVDPVSVPFSDEPTLSIFSSTTALGYKPQDMRCQVATTGIPEFGTRFVRQMLADTHPADFSGLVKISGLSHGTGVWLENAQELIKSKKASLAEIICARDDILNYLASKGVAADVAFRIMENVRKGRGISPEEEQAVLRAGVPGWYVDSCRRIKYLFPKAHATAYVMMAFRIAYFKVHFPEAFYAQYFNLRLQDLDLETMLGGSKSVLSRIKEIEQKGLEASPKEKDQATVLEVAHEMALRGIGIQPVSLYDSDPALFRLNGSSLVPPLAALQGMGMQAARSIAQSREQGTFTSIEEMRQRARIGRNILDLLRKAGCLAGLPENNQMALL